MLWASNVNSTDKVIRCQVVHLLENDGCPSAGRRGGFGAVVWLGWWLWPSRWPLQPSGVAGAGLKKGPAKLVGGAPA